jgi:hypothetical protein
MMGAMEPRGDEEAFAKPAIAYPRIRVSYTPQQPEAKNEERELERGHADNKAHRDEPYIRDRIFQYVRSIIGPEGHLIFGMMQGVNSIPPAISVRQPMTPIVGEIEKDEVRDEDNCGPRSEHRHQPRQ